MDTSSPRVRSRLPQDRGRGRGRAEVAFPPEGMARRTDARGKSPRRRAGSPRKIQRRQKGREHGPTDRGWAAASLNGLGLGGGFVAVLPCFRENGPAAVPRTSAATSAPWRSMFSPSANASRTTLLAAGECLPAGQRAEHQRRPRCGRHPDGPARGPVRQAREPVPPPEAGRVSAPARAIKPLRPRRPNRIATDCAGGPDRRRIGCRRAGPRAVRVPASRPQRERKFQTRPAGPILGLAATESGFSNFSTVGGLPAQFDGQQLIRVSAHRCIGVFGCHRAGHRTRLSPNATSSCNACSRATASFGFCGTAPAAGAAPCGPAAPSAVAPRCRDASRPDGPAARPTRRRQRRQN
jgi:hypothetical protein